MKGYKHTELGWIPETWQIMVGDEISSRITKGSSPKWQGFQYQNAGVLFVTSENVRDGYLDISKPKYLPSEFNLKQRSSILKKGDILINIVGASIGRSCVFNKTVEANVNQAVCVLSPKETVYSEYIANYLELPSSIDRLLNTQSASARPNLTLEDIRSFKFVIPPISEQRQISNIVTTWNKYIKALTHLIAAKQQLKKGLMQQLLTGKKRLPGFKGKWKELKLGSVFEKIIGGGTPSRDRPEYWNGTINWATVKDLSNFNPNKTQETITEEGLKNSASNLVSGGTLITSTRMLIGKSVIFNIDVAINQDLKALTPYRDYDTNFLYYFFENNLSEIEKLGNGSTVKGIGLDDFKNVIISIPPTVNEQKEVAFLFQLIDKEIARMQVQLEDFKLQKHGLMQQLLIGKKRVKV